MVSEMIMNIDEIMRLLPHRYPFLLVDRVTACEPGKSLHAYKNVSINEPFFTGHFPVKPIMPGVMIIEALAQAAGLLAFVTNENDPEEGDIFYFIGIDKARFRKPVVPGDRLDLKIELTRTLKKIRKFSAEAEVDGKTVASAELMCAAGKV
jgi:3-hydroxyacyl-[acyl-carrier-protein] dehydratase